MVFDMDGVLCDSMHRYRTIQENGIERIDLPYWRENERLACRDSLLPAFYSDYLPAIDNPDCIVIIATARVINKPDNYFIHHHIPSPNFLISRENGSTVSGGKLKVNGLKRIFNLQQFKGIDLAQSMTVFEDNVAYLKAICDALKIKHHYTEL